MMQTQGYVQAVKLFNRWLEHKGLRKTQERFAVLKMAWQLPAHFRAEDLLASLEQTGYHVSRGTIYNTLTLLVECGVIRRHHFGSSGTEALYEKGVGNHLHLICTRCGKVTEQEGGPEVSALTAPCRYQGFLPTHMSGYIYGICTQCAEKQKKTN